MVREIREEGAGRRREKRREKGKKKKASKTPAPLIRPPRTGQSHWNWIDGTKKGLETDHLGSFPPPDRTGLDQRTLDLHAHGLDWIGVGGEAKGRKEKNKLSRMIN